MRVSRRGKSLAIRLPAKLVRELGLREGDEIELRAGKDSPITPKRPSLQERLESARKSDRKRSHAGMTRPTASGRSPEEVMKSLDRFRGMLSGTRRLTRDELYEDGDLPGASPILRPAVGGLTSPEGEQVAQDSWKRVPVVHDPDLEPGDDRDEPLRVASVRAKAANDRSVIYLDLEVHREAGKGGRTSAGWRSWLKPPKSREAGKGGPTLRLALSPPAATQISELLEETVYDYLKSTPDPEME